MNKQSIAGNAVILSWFTAAIAAGTNNDAIITSAVAFVIVSAIAWMIVTPTNRPW